MVIKRQPIISWLLEEEYTPQKPCEITVPNIKNMIHVGYLANGINWLGQIRDSKPNWGLPELLMPSFEKVMRKSAKSFYNIDHQLFQEFYKDNECGILIHKQFGTIVYGFGEDTLYVWLFRDIDGYSVLYNYFYLVSTPNNVRKLHCWPTLISDSQLFNQDIKECADLYSCIANLLITYLAVKKYAQVETIVVSVNSKLIVEDEIKGYKQKEKVRNDSGQKVIIMDSRWFVKIINENDIFVRGFFRMQRYKNEEGEWAKKLIFVDSFIRHGYHRNAMIEDDSTYTNNRISDIIDETE